MQKPSNNWIEEEEVLEKVTSPELDRLLAELERVRGFKPYGRMQQEGKNQEMTYLGHRIEQVRSKLRGV